MEIKAGDRLYFVKAGNKTGKYITIQESKNDYSRFAVNNEVFFINNESTTNNVYDSYNWGSTGETLPTKNIVGRFYKTKKEHMEREELLNLSDKFRSFVLSMNLAKSLTLDQAQRIWAILKESK